MMESFSHFGDVVCFDTTYRKNHDCRPFAMFVGVNHHKQTTLFGAALLYDETCETFIWLFDTFSEAMLGKKPKTILTDQNTAMANALESQWPETYHRLCIWHIYQNAAKHLSSVFQKFRQFATDFGDCIYEFEEEDEFIEVWKKMLERYNLKDNDWLERMFKLKEKWALVYGRDSFCANMTTTQRSESMNNVLKHYVSYQHSMLRFFQHFERLVDDRRYEESKADFKTTQRKLPPSLPIDILNHAATVYTPSILKMFEFEFSKAYNCVMEICCELGMKKIYKLTPNGKRFHHTVNHDSSNDTVTCSCKKFEFAGILCSHILKVFSSRNIGKIPSQYILKRWTKYAKTGTITFRYENTHLDDPKTCMARRYKELSRAYTQISTRGSISENAYKVAIQGFKRTFDDVEACLRGEEIPGIYKNDVGNPIDTKLKGVKKKGKMSGKSRRPKGVLEKSKKKKNISHQNLSVEEVLSNHNAAPIEPNISSSFLTSPFHFSQVSSSLNMNGEFNKNTSLAPDEFEH
ncbi:protein FAR-RED IMPAIRED RESPONSE 1-like isoform X1 [Humulus lupulus]|uniref:protein FAR-RED IMPAIRED RESPONSE 1-like isoform X1 n=1 Tax=Humulus lupulus TaxID=3486 RepID=UPI002B404E2C|nr:protein FAR-RED IMPAIRED RESPONSE 1-like isoform X1 [Humulus lupulus]